ncbi:MAG TPA: FtsW/RodA/SpoVE family cell cycle protein [Pirellulales bacterium]|jgi:cell division protein FtsW (lipid II flippase)
MHTNAYFNTRRWPWAAIVAGVVLMALGAAAIARSDELVQGTGRLLRQQVVWLALGLGLGGAAALVDYRRLARFGFTIYAVLILALAAVYFFPAVNGAHRWIRIGGIGIQPSEFAKLAFILALARSLKLQRLAGGLAQADDDRPRAPALDRFVAEALWPTALALAPMLLVLKEPDLGTSLVFLPVLFAMLFAAGARRRDLLLLAMCGLVLAPLLWSQMSREQRSRITALAEQNGPRETATADGFHLDQAKRMFATGGWWGTIWQSTADEADDRPAATRLPEPHTDSIFCVVTERFGLAGAGLLLLLYLVLVGQCLLVAARTEDDCGRLISAGVAALFAAEVLINTGMLAGLLPITGLALPLVSYGGSDLIAHLLALGIVANISRNGAET